MKKTSLFKSTGWNALLVCWQTLLMFMLTPFLISRLGESHYGLYVLMATLTGVMGIMTLGLGEATLRFVAHYYGKDDTDGIQRVIGSTLFIYCITGTIGCLAFQGFTPQIAQLLKSDIDNIELIRILRIVGINFGLMFFVNALASVPVALERFDVNTRALIFRSVFQTAGAVSLLLFGYGLTAIIFWLLVSSLFSLIVQYTFAKRLLPHVALIPKPSRQGIREVFSYGVFSLATQLLFMLWQNTDRLLLGTLVNSSTVGQLTVPQTACIRGTGLISQMGQVLFPRFSMLHCNVERMALFQQATWGLLCISIALFLPITLLMEPFLSLWISEEFASKSTMVGQIIAGSCMIRGAFIPYDNLLKGMGKPQYLTGLYACTAITSVAVNILLIPHYGLKGAGYAYAITPLWGLVAITVIYFKLSPQPIIWTYIRILWTPAILGFGALAILYRINFSGYLTSWIRLGAAGAALSIGMLSTLVLTEYISGRQNSFSKYLIKQTLAVLQKKRG